MGSLYATLLLAAEAAEGGGFDPATNPFVQYGLLGAFILLLFRGGQFVLKREKDAAEATAEKIIAEKDKQIALHEATIKTRDEQLVARDNKIEELNSFIIEELVTKQASQLARHVDIITKAVGLEKPRRRSDAT